MPIDKYHGGNAIENEKSINSFLNTRLPICACSFVSIFSSSLFARSALLNIVAMRMRLAGFDPAIFKDPSYWIMLALTGLSIILVTLSVRDFFREKELRENTEVVETQKKLDAAHAELIRLDLTTSLK